MITQRLSVVLFASMLVIISIPLRLTAAVDTRVEKKPLNVVLILADDLGGPISDATAVVFTRHQTLIVWRERG